MNSGWVCVAGVSLGQFCGADARCAVTSRRGILSASDGVIAIPAETCKRRRWPARCRARQRQEGEIKIAGFAPGYPGGIPHRPAAKACGDGEDAVDNGGPSWGLLQGLGNPYPGTQLVSQPGRRQQPRFLPFRQCRAGGSGRRIPAGEMAWEGRPTPPPREEGPPAIGAPTVERN